MYVPVKSEDNPVISFRREVKKSENPDCPHQKRTKSLQINLLQHHLVNKHGKATTNVHRYQVRKEPGHHILKHKKIATTKHKKK